MVPNYDELMRQLVRKVMTEAVVHVESAAPLTRVVQLMVSLKSRSFPVSGPDRLLVGMISREDVIRALQEAHGKLAKPARPSRTKSDTEAMVL